MKKEMFNVWYNEYGRELAKNALPIDDVDEKDIRRKAKEIFSYTYDIFSEFIRDRLSLMRNHIIDYLENSNEYAEEFAMRKKCAEKLRNDITPYVTNLYDSYYKEKSIKKEQFDSLKNHFGEILSNAKNTINNCDGILSMLKQEKKLVESLLVTE